MTDVLEDKISKYHDAVNEFNWQRLESALYGGLKQGIASFIHPLGAERPEDGDEKFVQAEQVEMLRRLNFAPKIVGGVFFDHAAVEDFKESGNLALTIGDYNPDPSVTQAEHEAATIAVGKSVVKLLKRRAMTYDWDGTATGKIVVDMTAHNKNFTYKDMDEELEEFLLDGDLVVDGHSDSSGSAN